MLFAAKRTWGTATIAVIVLMTLSLLLKAALGTEWTLQWQSPFFMWLLAATICLAASDGLVHCSLLTIVKFPYAAVYRQFARYFQNQGVLLMAMGGVIAAAEELFFRGIIQNYLRESVGLVAAVLVTSLCFGACHLIPRQGLRLFAIWAVWESVILGTVYALTGSLLLNCVLHCMHDFVGFVALRIESRRTSNGAE